MERVLEPIFSPIKELIAHVYDLLFDAATKVWKLAKPVAMIGLLLDFLTGKLGWITTIMNYYRQFVHDTSGASWIMLVVFAMLALTYMAKK